MSDNTRNAVALLEARETVSTFERMSQMTSDEMLSCQQGDIRLAQFDSFELMDWHYALEQIKAFSSGRVLRSLHGEARATISYSTLYQRRYTQDLVNAQEPELLLVA